MISLAPSTASRLTWRIVVMRRISPSSSLSFLRPGRRQTCAMVLEEKLTYLEAACNDQT